MTAMVVGWRDNHAASLADEYTTKTGRHTPDQEHAAQLLTLGQHEYVVKVDLRTWRVKKHTRIGFMRVTTNLGHVMACGNDFTTGTVYSLSLSLSYMLGILSSTVCCLARRKHTFSVLQNVQMLTW